MNNKTCSNCEWYYKEHCANGNSDNCTEPMSEGDYCEGWSVEE
jgi:hypothetical protein